MTITEELNTPAAPATVEAEIARLEVRRTELMQEHETALQNIHAAPGSAEALDAFTRVEEEITKTARHLGALRASVAAVGRKRWEDFGADLREQALAANVELLRVTGEERLRLAERIDSRTASLLKDIAEWVELGQRAHGLVRHGVQKIAPPGHKGVKADLETLRKASLGYYEILHQLRDLLEGRTYGRDLKEGGGMRGVAQQFAGEVSAYLARIMAEIDRAEKGEADVAG